MSVLDRTSYAEEATRVVAGIDVMSNLPAVLDRVAARSGGAQVGFLPAGSLRWPHHTPLSAVSCDGQSGGGAR